jgi:hypothetical protein
MCFVDLNETYSIDFACFAKSTPILKKTVYLAFWPKKAKRLPFKFFLSYNFLMAKVKFIDIPAGLEPYFKKVLQAGDRFVYSTVRMPNPFISRKKRAGLTQKSQLPLCSQLWNNLTELIREDWTECGLETGLTGFRFFVQDKVLRLKNSLEGESTPSLLYQSMVGRLHVESPATGLLITQLHPLTYYVMRKITGKATMYSPVEVIEQFALPLNIYINYKSDLTAISGGYVARFYAIVYSSYQGRTIETPVDIDFDLDTDWKSASVGVGEVIGLVRGYALFLELDGVTGDVWFDNVQAVHSGQNWVRDTNCNNIKMAYTKKFFQVPAHWVAIDLPTGSYYNSEYGNL